MFVSVYNECTFLYIMSVCVFVFLYIMSLCFLFCSVLFSFPLFREGCGDVLSPFSGGVTEAKSSYMYMF